MFSRLSFSVEGIEATAEAALTSVPASCLFSFFLRGFDPSSSSQLEVGRLCGSSQQILPSSAWLDGGCLRKVRPPGVSSAVRDTVVNPVLPELCAHGEPSAQSEVLTALWIRILFNLVSLLQPWPPCPNWAWSGTARDHPTSDWETWKS